MVVDDYVPVHKKMPIFVGPIRMNEIYPMLIEKALAKAAGTYEDIPEEAEQVLEMLFCGPVSTNAIVALREKDTLGERLQNALDQKQLTVLISRKDSKIRNYGINDGEVYLVIKHHEITWMGEELRELQESRMSFLNQSQFRPAMFSEVKSMKTNRLQQQESNSLSYSKTNVMLPSLKLGEGRKQTEHVYECISESKLSGWNGRYSLND